MTSTETHKNTQILSEPSQMTEEERAVEELYGSDLS
jgi:hypothetical protein